MKHRAEYEPLVTTSRLDLYPLTYEQLKIYLKAGNLLEDLFGFQRTGRNVSPDVNEVVQAFTLPNMKGVPRSGYLFFTFWLVVDRSLNIIVAELGFKGMPNIKKEIEIQYGTMPAYSGRGYMTEAVAGVLAWVTSRDDVASVLAETDESNHASIRVVQKNGFIEFERRGEMIWWRRDNEPRRP